MEKIFLFLFFLLSLTTFGISGADAQDAQASLLDSAMDQKQYTIPAGLTKNERQWFIKFQEGNFFVDGWQDITISILEKTPVAEQPKQKKLLAELGNKIGTEWCKDNDIRKIDTDMLKIWGKQLKNTAKKNPDHLETVLVAISNELDSLNQ
ncbi:hypothetical protein [Desulfogranum marinum]|uniref:hypothetical protein n=1 Tax=Desulfogranum marinum TaxID=453220 RepID=UPI0029C939D9|nr:hypothetical protein [Desulfogranum marinum]